MKKCVILLVLLTVTLAYQFFGPYARRAQIEVPDFDKYLPLEIEGWVVEDKPVADSPEMLRVVESILRYDTAVFRTYRKGAAEISVYVAYWLPGKVHRESVDTHTPDVCWVANGWEMKRQPPLEDRIFASSRVPIPNHRSFRTPGSQLSVLYWHIEGGGILQSLSIEDSKQKFSERVVQRVSQVLKSIVQPPESQLFVRISSNGDISKQLEIQPVDSTLRLVAANINQN